MDVWGEKGGRERGKQPPTLCIASPALRPGQNNASLVGLLRELTGSSSTSLTPPSPALQGRLSGLLWVCGPGGLPATESLVPGSAARAAVRSSSLCQGGAAYRHWRLCQAGHCQPAQPDATSSCRSSPKERENCRGPLAGLRSLHCRAASGQEQPWLCSKRLLVTSCDCFPLLGCGPLSSTQVGLPAGVGRECPNPNKGHCFEPDPNEGLEQCRSRRGLAQQLSRTEQLWPPQGAVSLLLITGFLA